jgi:hypothetical protein
MTRCLDLMLLLLDVNPNPKCKLCLKKSSTKIKWPNVRLDLMNVVIITTVIITMTL